MDQEHAEGCRMSTKKLTLSAETIAVNACNGGAEESACLMLFGVIIPVGSLLVSGSVVLAGNILHWLEYQGSCEKT